MATPVLLITEPQLKQWAQFTDQVRFGGPLTAAILAAQRGEIKPILGADLYNELVQQVGTNTLTTENQLLLDEYVVPCLANYAHYQWLPSANLRTREQGVVMQSGQNAESAAVSDLSYLRNSVKATAAAYGRDLEQFLKDNEADYPPYKACCNDVKSGDQSLYSGKIGLI